MGKPAEPYEQRTFIGVSVSDGSEPAKLFEALLSAAEKVVDERLAEGDRTAWFKVTSLEVEVSNQNIKTFKAGITGPQS
jgi:hypothetical protein